MAGVFLSMAVACTSGACQLHDAYIEHCYSLVVDMAATRQQCSDYDYDVS